MDILQTFAARMASVWRPRHWKKALFFMRRESRRCQMLLVQYWARCGRMEMVNNTMSDCYVIINAKRFHKICQMLI